MIKKIAIGLAVVVGGFLAFAATRPATWKVERTATMQAPADVVFSFVDNLPARHEWYPWDKMDPNQTLTYSEAKSGVGAWYSWSGNDQVGSGKSTVAEVVANQKLVDDLHFMTPMEGTAKATFELRNTTNANTTQVVWSVEGENNFAGKVMSIFFDMDEMMGKTFEDGLNSLNTVSTAAYKQKLIEQTSPEAQKAAEIAPGTMPAVDGVAAPAAPATAPATETQPSKG